MEELDVSFTTAMLREVSAVLYFYTKRTAIHTLHVHACANLISSVCVGVSVRSHADEQFVCELAWVGLF